jgi:uncharacterized protein (DUF433 family)
MKFCPTCGNPNLPIEVRVDLDNNAIVHRGQAAELTPREAEILFVLAKRVGQTVYHERVRSQVYGVASTCAAESKSIHVVISRIRRKIAPLGLEVACDHGVGYGLKVVERVADRMPIVRWSRAKVERLAELCKAGTPRDEIAREFGWRIDQVQSMYAYLRKHAGFPHALPRRANLAVKRRVA